MFNLKYCTNKCKKIAKRNMKVNANPFGNHSIHRRNKSYTETLFEKLPRFECKIGCKPFIRLLEYGSIYMRASILGAIVIILNPHKYCSCNIWPKFMDVIFEQLSSPPSTSVLLC